MITEVKDLGDSLELTEGASKILIEKSMIKLKRATSRVFLFDNSTSGNMGVSGEAQKYILYYENIVAPATASTDDLYDAIAAFLNVSTGTKVNVTNEFALETTLQEIKYRGRNSDKVSDVQSAATMALLKDDIDAFENAYPNYLLLSRVIVYNSASDNFTSFTDYSAI